MYYIGNYSRNKPKTVITEDTMNSVILMYVNTCVPVREIASQHGLTVSQVYTIIKKARDPECAKVPVSEAVAKQLACFPKQIHTKKQESVSC